MFLNTQLNSIIKYLKQITFSGKMLYQVSRGIKYYISKVIIYLIIQVETLNSKNTESIKRNTSNNNTKITHAKTSIVLGKSGRKAPCTHN